MRQVGKKWSFQREQAAGGNPHYQGRVSLHKKKRLAELRALLRDTNLTTAHWSPSSTNSGASFSYVTKLDTRIAGPWHDTDEVPEVFVMPDDIAEIEKLRPWQQRIVTWATHHKWERRKIVTVVDLVGGVGKTTLKRWLQCHHREHVQILPPLSDAKDMAQFIMSTRRDTTRCYVIDIPRACTDAKVLARLYGALETIKDGSCYDTRYKGREMVFTPPRVLVFTNTTPELKWMSKDRWVTLNIDETEELAWMPGWPKHTEIPLTVDWVAPQVDPPAGAAGAAARNGGGGP